MPKLKGKIEELTITSKALEREMPLLIYLPPNYSDLYTYPLAIVQDGRDYFQLGRLPKVADQLIEAGDIEDLIMVGIPYENPEVRWEMYHPDGKWHQEYVTFLVYELLPFIKEHYAVCDLAGNRTLIGDSLGGTVSLLTAIHYPNTFSNVIMQSPYVDERIVKTAEVSANLSAFSIYHVIGKKETEVKTTHGKIQNFLEPNRELKDILSSKTMADYFYHELEGDHTWKSWQPDVFRSLQEMFKKSNY
ncbi:enterochelin esterase-like enzyme [Scopulibacillus darangshiensis]|uniref:Enterochelin esterase-like enzyme n=1 Tax=Scopulibacillus darangshiensis TaxID=442528 RepID=A0A4V2SKG9_9BACL|nr:alpha/beta hydrolase-fold protein [Scopulibacillus darangshiensis]TCP19506.1 enterochelin esterase-like enzyme [Scopulibacillus darangshiensis]